jgi:hypothetical protein
MITPHAILFITRTEVARRKVIGDLAQALSQAAAVPGDTKWEICLGRKERVKASILSSIRNTSSSKLGEEN